MTHKAAKRRSAVCCIQPLESRCLLSAVAPVILKDIAPGNQPSGPRDFITIGNETYFLASDGSSEGIWKTDGTSAGTLLVLSLGGDFNVQDLYAAGNELFFTDGSSYVDATDVNGAPVVQVFSAPPLTPSTITPTHFTSMGNQLFFDFGTDMYRTDGTVAGTYKIEPQGSTILYPTPLTVFENNLYFTSKSGLFKTDGTLAGTQPIPVGGEVGYSMFRVGTDLYYFDGARLFRDDGSGSGPLMLYTGDVDINNIFVLGNLVLFKADGELWRTDGTVAGTYFLDSFDQTQSSGPWALESNGLLFFRGDGGVTRTDGTVTGTIKLNGTALLGSAGGYFYMLAGQYLVKTDGTQAGTSIVRQLFPISAAPADVVAPMVDVNGVGYFAVNSPNYVWTTDGMAAGTHPINGVSFAWFLSQPPLILNVDGHVVFRASNSQYGLEPVTVAPIDPPVAVPGGPYFVNEGSKVTLDATGSIMTAGPDATYTWTTPFNFMGDHPLTLRGATPVFDATNLTGSNIPLAMNLVVTDEWGNISSPAKLAINIVDLPPTAIFTGGTLVAGSSGYVAFTAQHDVLPYSTFTYSYDFNNDGTFEITNSNTASATVPASYLTTLGNHTIRGRITDDGGAYTDYTATITVVAPASISGTVFSDDNGNARQDSGESGIGGRLIYIDQNNDGQWDNGERAHVTPADGTFDFTGLAPGTYRLRDLPPAGWRRIVPAAGYEDITVSAGQDAIGANFAETNHPIVASISGTVFADNNGNGKLDSGEAGVSGRKLYIDKNKNGVLDAGEPTFTTGTSGAFTFTGLAAGTYRVRDVLPSGWRRVSPVAGYYDVTVTAGQAISGKNFAETTRGLISGTVFKDANGNAIKDSPEVGLSGWVVYLDTNNNGKLDAGELSFTTGADGKFSFVVPAGTYHLREVLKSGFSRTAPSTGVYTITLSSGQTISGKNFGDN